MNQLITETIKLPERVRGRARNLRYHPTTNEIKYDRPAGDDTWETLVFSWPYEGNLLEVLYVDLLCITKDKDTGIWVKTTHGDYPITGDMNKIWEVLFPDEIAMAHRWHFVNAHYVTKVVNHEITVRCGIKTITHRVGDSHYSDIKQRFPKKPHPINAK